MGVRVCGNGGRGVYALVEEFGGRAGSCVSGDGRGGGCGGRKGRGGECVGGERRGGKRVGGEGEEEGGEEGVEEGTEEHFWGVDRDGMVYRFCLMGKFWR